PKKAPALREACSLDFGGNSPRQGMVGRPVSPHPDPLPEGEGQGEGTARMAQWKPVGVWNVPCGENGSPSPQGRGLGETARCTVPRLGPIPELSNPASPPPGQARFAAFFSSMAAWAAARRATGTRNGEQLT